jgi:hypothetical protein
MICDKYRRKNTGPQCVKHELLNRLWSILAVNVLKSGSLNLLEPSGPAKACNGIALPFVPVYSVCSVTSVIRIPESA